MLEGREREHSRAVERSLMIECTIAIEPLADFDSWVIDTPSNISRRRSLAPKQTIAHPD
jgi:hypothetical protein